MKSSLSSRGGAVPGTGEPAAAPSPGWRNSAHIAAVDPAFEGQVCACAARERGAAGPARHVLRTTGLPALLLRSTDGEPFADPRRRPKIEFVRWGARSTGNSGEGAGSRWREPATIDTHATAGWIRQRSREGRRFPIPGQSARLLSLRMQVHRDMYQAKAIAASRDRQPWPDRAPPSASNRNDHCGCAGSKGTSHTHRAEHHQCHVPLEPASAYGIVVAVPATAAGQRPLRSAARFAATMHAAPGSQRGLYAVVAPTDAVTGAPRGTVLAVADGVSGGGSAQMAVPPCAA
jgi:hypothetical protein